MKIESATWADAERAIPDITAQWDRFCTVNPALQGRPIHIGVTIVHGYTEAGIFGALHGVDVQVNTDRKDRKVIISFYNNGTIGVSMVHRGWHRSILSLDLEDALRGHSVP